MIKKLAAIVASAVCAGLIFAFVLGFAPEVAAGTKQSIDQGVPSSVTVNAAAVEFVPTAADIRSAVDIRKAVERNLHNGSRNPKIACEKSWPYYEPSCLRAPHHADGTHVVRVISADRSATGRALQAQR